MSIVAEMRPLHGPATIRAPPPSFLLPPTFPSTAHTARKRAAPLYRSLVPSWLSAEQDGQRPERYAESQTLHAPIQRFETPKLSSGPRSPDIESDATCEFGKEYGLLCLEREVPEDVSSALEQVADSADPFKVEVLRSHTQDDESWLDTLVSEPFSAAAVDPEIRPLRMLSQTEKSQQRQVKDNAVGEVSEATHTARRKTILPDRDSVEAPTAAHQQHQQRQQVSSVTDKAVRWLKMDVKRVANIFVQEITSLNQGVHAVGATVAAAPAFPAAARAGGDGGDAVDVTVKLELLKKGKCPRFHLDKVPLRLICTYVGPSTEWLDGYDSWQLEHNKSLPPACNQEISCGREVRTAAAGNVLIFRGQPQGGASTGAVVHRSPDMVEGERRLVLTMDIGNIL